MRTYLRMIIVWLACCSAGYAASDCDAVLKYTGLRTLNSLTNEQLSDLDYYFNCTSEGRAKGASLLGTSSILDLKVGGSSYRTSSACTERVREINNSKFVNVVTSQPVEAAIAAWLACGTAGTQSLKVNMFDDPDGVGVFLENGIAAPLSLAVTASQAVEQGSRLDLTEDCSVEPAALETSSIGGSIAIQIPGKSGVTVTCPRRTVQATRLGISTRINPAISMRFVSGQNQPLSFPFIERIIDVEGISTLQEIKERLDTLAATYQTVGTGASVTGPFVGAGKAVPHPLIECPSGQYVAGLYLFGPQFHGAQLSCRPFILPKPAP